MRRVAWCLLLSLMGCASDSGTLTGSIVRSSTPAYVVRDTGNAQVGIAGSTAMVAPRVRVLDADSHPLAGVELTCVATSGSLPYAGTTTDRDGFADCGKWMLGERAGIQTMAIGTARPPQLTAQFIARVLPAAASQIRLLSGDEQYTTIGTPVPRSPVVRVTDSYGNPTPGVVVTFEPGANSGTVTAGSVMADALGVAAPGLWTVGQTPGPVHLVVTAGASTPVAIRAFAQSVTSQSATHAILLAGDAQAAAVGTRVPIDPAVLVLDANEQPVANVAVTFTTTPGSGTVSAGAVTTGPDGVASVNWTLGPTPGVDSLYIKVFAKSGTLTIPIAATGLVGAPATILPVLGDGQIDKPGNVLAESPKVRVLDAHSNPVAGVTVIFAVRTGGSTLAGGVTMTDAAGYASAGTWKLSTVEGTTTVEAQVGSLAPVTFTATGVK